MSRSLSTQFHPVPYLSEVRQIKPVLFKPKQLPVCLNRVSKAEGGQEAAGTEARRGQSSCRKGQKGTREGPFGTLVASFMQSGTNGAKTGGVEAMNSDGFLE